MCFVLKANIMSVRAAGWSTISYIQKKGWSFLHSVEFVYFQSSFNFMKHPTSRKLIKGKAIAVQALRAPGV